MPPYSYNVNPAPRQGSGIYGRVPGSISLPSPSSDLSARYPNLGRTNAALSSDIYSGLQGQLSPGTLRDLQDFDAAWGIGSGMPGSGLAINRLGRNIGLTAEQLKNTAIGQYNATLPTISRTQTVTPETQIGLAETNAINASAPDPTAAGSHAEQLYQRYLQGLSGGGRVAGGPGGGTRQTYDQEAGPEVVGASTGTGTSYGGQMYYGNNRPGGGTGNQSAQPGGFYDQELDFLDPEVGQYLDSLGG